MSTYGQSKRNRILQRGQCSQVTLRTPSLMLYNYGGDERDIVRQLTAAISREGHTLRCHYTATEGCPS